MNEVKTGLRDLIPLSFYGFEIIVQENISSDLKQKIAAAILCHVFEAKSVDYVLKKYIKEITDEDQNIKIDTTHKILNKIKDSLSQIEKKHHQTNYTEEKIGIFGAHHALKRLIISYDSCILLINLGCLFEAQCIARMIFEQLNYCINICDLEDSYFEAESSKERDKVFNSTNITKMKRLIKVIDIGRLYSNLTKMAHIDKETVNNYIKYDKAINGTSVLLRDRKETSVTALLLLTLCYIHEVALEYIFKRYLDNFEFIQNHNSTYESIIHKRYEHTIQVYKKMYS